MLRDNALKFYSDDAFIIPHKPIENGQYINNNRSITFEPCGFTTYEFTTFWKYRFWGHMNPQGYMTSET